MIFGFVNVHLIIRDGWNRFFETGYVTTNEGLIALVGGLIFRTLGILSIAWLVRKRA